MLSAAAVVYSPNRPVDPRLHSRRVGVLAIVRRRHPPLLFEEPSSIYRESTVKERKRVSTVCGSDDENAVMVRSRDRGTFA